jgi:tetratricopeptide (TPR) repeat protein
LPDVGDFDSLGRMTALFARPGPLATPARFRRAIAAAMLAAAVAAAYQSYWPGSLVFDDFSTVADNESIRRLWPPAWLTPPAGAGVGGRPFANFTFALNHAISGTAPWSYLGTNLLLHGMTALVLYGVVRRTLLQPGFGTHPTAAAGALALVVAALWAVHPLASGTVGYISQRTELLMSCCFLLTLYAFIRSAETGSRGWAVAAVAVCGLGMAAKEVMGAAPILVLLYDRTFLAGSFRAAWRTRGRIHLALASTWLLLGGLALSSGLGERGVGFALGLGAGDYLLIEARAIWHYLRLAVWPQPLIFDYGRETAPALANALPALVGCVALVGAVLVAVWRRPALGFAGAWFLLILAPTSSVIPIVEQPVAENRMYLPLAAVLAALVVAAHRCIGRRTKVLVVTAGAMAVAAGVTTASRGQLFRSEVALWTETALRRPANARAHGNLGAALLRAGRLSEAVAALEMALHLQPVFADAQVNLGVAVARNGRRAEAMAHYESALRVNPEQVEARYNLASALVEAGRPAEAVAHFEAVVRRQPHRAAAHNNLSVALLQVGRADEAARAARAALQLEPVLADAHYNLGNALARLGETDLALAAFEAALRLQPRFPKAHNNLGVLHLRAGRSGEARAHFEAALRLDPDYPEARRNLEAIRGR